MEATSPTLHSKFSASCDLFNELQSRCCILPSSCQAGSSETGISSVLQKIPRIATHCPLSPRVALISPLSRRLIKSYVCFVSPSFCPHGQHYIWSTLWNWLQLSDLGWFYEEYRNFDNCRVLVHCLYLVSLKVECRCFVLCCYLVINYLCQCFCSLSGETCWVG